jgi:protein SCO1/2
LGLVLVGTGVALITGLGSRTAEGPPPSLQGVVLSKPKPLNGIPELKDHDGKPFGHAQFQGMWTVLFFGYAHCPDVCPTALATLGEAFRTLEQKDPERFKQTRGVFVSVDPKRDTPEQLKSFVGYFHPGFLGVTGDDSAVERFSRAFGAFYQIEPGDDPQNYVVNHIASLFVVSPEGNLAALLQPRLYKGPVLAEKILEIERALSPR